MINDTGIQEFKSSGQMFPIVTFSCCPNVSIIGLANFLYNSYDSLEQLSLWTKIFERRGYCVVIINLIKINQIRVYRELHGSF